MATIINNPTDTRPVSTSDDSPVGIIVGLLVALVLIVLFVMYVLPSINGGAARTSDTPGSSANINLSLPGTGSDTGTSGSGSGSNTGTGASAEASVTR